MNIGYERLLTIMGNLKKGTADTRDQKLAYDMLVRLSRKAKELNKMMDELIEDPYVRKVKRS